MRGQRGEEGKLRDGNGRGWEVKQILNEDNAVFMAESRKDLQHILNEFEMECDRKE